MWRRPLAIGEKAQRASDRRGFEPIRALGSLLPVVALYFVLGAMLDVFGMLVLTIPFVLPVVTALGRDCVWFGVFIVIMQERALVTSAIGANVFIMRRVAPISRWKTCGTFPFVVGENWEC